MEIIVRKFNEKMPMKTGLKEFSFDPFIPEFIKTSFFDAVKNQKINKTDWIIGPLDSRGFFQLSCLTFLKSEKYYTSLSKKLGKEIGIIPHSEQRLILLHKEKLTPREIFSYFVRVKFCDKIPEIFNGKQVSKQQAKNDTLSCIIYGTKEECISILSTTKIFRFDKGISKGLIAVQVSDILNYFQKNINKEHKESKFLRDFRLFDTFYWVYYQGLYFVKYIKNSSVYFPEKDKKFTGILYNNTTVKFTDPTIQKYVKEIPRLKKYIFLPVHIKSKKSRYLWILFDKIQKKIIITEPVMNLEILGNGLADLFEELKLEIKEVKLRKINREMLKIFPSEFVAFCSLNKFLENYDEYSLVAAKFLSYFRENQEVNIKNFAA